MQGFEIVREDIFIPYKLSKRTTCVKISVDIARKISLEAAGLLCLVARKELK